MTEGVRQNFGIRQHSCRNGPKFSLLLQLKPFPGVLGVKDLQQIGKNKIFNGVRVSVCRGLRKEKVNKTGKFQLYNPQNDGSRWLSNLIYANFLERVSRTRPATGEGTEVAIGSYVRQNSDGSTQKSLCGVKKTH